MSILAVVGYIAVSALLSLAAIGIVATDIECDISRTGCHWVCPAHYEPIGHKGEWRAVEDPRTTVFCRGDGKLAQP